MRYKTVLVHADLSRHAPARIHAAALLAHEHGAHLTGAAMRGVSRAICPNGYHQRPGTLSAACFDPLAENARQALQRFEAIASERGVPRAAVVDLGNRQVAFVRAGGAFRAVSVQTGLRSADGVQVLRGVTAQDQVAANAQFLVDSEGFVQTSKTDYHD